MLTLIMGISRLHIMRQDFFAEPLQHPFDLLKRQVALVGLPDKPFRVGGFDQQIHLATNITGGSDQGEVCLFQTVGGAFRGRE